MKGQSEHNDLKKKFEDFTFPVDESNWDAISSRMQAGSGNGFLGKKFSVFTAQPSPRVWSKIEAAIQPVHKRRLAAWWWYAAAASLLAFAYLGYEIFRPADADQQLAQKKSETEIQSGSADLSENGHINSDKVLTDTIHISSGSLQDTHFPEGEPKPETENAETDAATPENRNFLTDENTEQKGKRSGTSKKDENRIVFSGENEENLAGKQPDNTAVPERGASMSVAKLVLRNPEIQVYSDQASLAGEMKDAYAKVSPDEKQKKSTGFYDGTENPSTRDFSLWGGSQLAFAGSGNEENADRLSSTGNGIGFSLYDGNLITREYSPPIYYGINGEIKFWKRLSGGVGFGYLHMQSASKQYFGSGLHLEREITYSYLSVPLYLKFNFIDKPKFAAYTSLGHAFDIMIGQKVSLETYQSAQLTNSESFNDGTKSNQANIYTGLGMHLKFTRNIGVFAEGSLMHYYHMSNDNFYSQQDFWPGLRFGLLFSFE